MVRRSCAAAMLAGAWLLGAACKGPKGSAPEAADPTAVVATVGGRPITLGYFEQRIEKMDRRYLPDTLDLAGRKKFLEFIVNKEIMALKAEELNYGNDPLVKNNLQIMEDNMVANAAIEQITKGKLDVTDADIEAFEAKRKQKAFVKQIIVKTRAEAEAVRAELAKGADFDALAKRHSIAPRSTPQGDSIPDAQRINMEVQFGDAIIPVEEAVFGTEVGKVSEPVQTGYGWQIFKPISIQEVTRSPLDSEGRRRNTVQIQLRRKRQIVEKYYEDILAEHKFALDEDALNLVYDKLPVDVAPENAPDPKTEQKPVLALSMDERNRRLFDMDGKTVTIGEFSDKYDATNWFERPKQITGALGVRYWIRDRWFKPMQLERARRDGVDKLPSVTDELKMRREQMMVTLLHENMVGSEAPDPTDVQIADFYAAHKWFYVEQERRRCNVIFNVKEQVVRNAYEEVKSGKNFVEVAIAYSESATKPDDVKSPEFSADASGFAEIAPPVFALQKVGDYTEPFKATAGWAVLQLDSVTPERQLPLDEAREAVVGDWQNQWREDRLNTLLADWKKTVPVEVNEKVLQRATVKRQDVVVPGREPAAAAGTK